MPPDGAIAEGSAYPAHNRTRTENRVANRGFTNRKEFFHHEA